MPVVIEEQPLPVREARAGEPAAWEALLARYRLPLYAYVFELVQHEQTSLDIVQESLIAAARHIASLREDGKFGSWLFNIAHQKCIQHWRRQRPAEVPIDLGQLVGRCMGNLQIVDRALAKFEVCFDKDLAELEQCLERQEVDEVRRLAHRLKGSAASVAAGGLARCSTRLEELARSRQLNEVPPCVGRLRREWSRFLSFRARHDELRPATSLDQDGGVNRFM